MGYALVWLINTVVQLFIWAVIINAIMSWLIAFNVLNPRSQFVYQIGRFFEAVTEPLLGPFRRIIPNLGGIDISPIVVILLLQFALMIFNRMAAPGLISLLG
jgi:YggT family protein